MKIASFIMSHHPCAPDIVKTIVSTAEQYLQKGTTFCEKKERLQTERTIEYGHEYPHTQEHLEHSEGSENGSNVSSRS